MSSTLNTPETQYKDYLKGYPHMYIYKHTHIHPTYNIHIGYREDIYYLLELLHIYLFNSEEIYKKYLHNFFSRQVSILLTL